MTDIQDLGQAVYSQQEPEGEQQASDEQEEEPEEPDAVEGEFREV